MIITETWWEKGIGSNQQKNEVFRKAYHCTESIGWSFYALRLLG